MQIANQVSEITIIESTHTSIKDVGIIHVFSQLLG